MLLFAYARFGLLLGPGTPFWTCLPLGPNDACTWQKFLQPLSTKFCISGPDQVWVPLIVQDDPDFIRYS